ncbi:MAG: GHKL domain-containing protein [Magnetospirillum sp.]|nr:GHKL domain-containing protein [Magnetospirillum sp.]
MGGLEEGGGAARVLVLLAGLLAVLLWTGFGWNSSLERHLAAILSSDRLPYGVDFGGFLAFGVLIAALAALSALLMQAIYWQRRTAQRLRQREEELTEHRERLRRYVADLERIADVTAHDLQEPLRRVVSYSQLLASHDQAGADEDVKTYVSHVVDGARRMKAMVSGLRAFVSVDSLPDTGEICPASAAMVIARQRLAETLAAADVALVVDPLPEVAADQASLVEIFVQLLDNAVRFRSAHRRPVIHVSASRDGEMARFLVRDNGIGIDGSAAARMFEIFYRPRGGDESKSAGIGMGLAVVRRLVERLGGSVWLDSESGKGSTFGFSLRLESPRGNGLRRGGMEVRAA